MGHIALVTGVMGQDGSYMAELLLTRGYEVVGVEHNADNFRRYPVLSAKIRCVVGDISEQNIVETLLKTHTPHEVYNFAAVSNVFAPHTDMSRTVLLNGMTPVYFLEYLRKCAPHTKFFQASSAEMFAYISGAKNEESDMLPRSPYGHAKLFAHRMVSEYRCHSGVYAVSGIFFNHESPRRGDKFVTKKIVNVLARIAQGTEEVLEVGNLDGKRDWGDAQEYMELVFILMQQEHADDYVIATGVLHSVRDVIKYACEYFGVQVVWQGKGLEEVGLINGVQRIRVSPDFYRAADTLEIRGDITKLETVLGKKTLVPLEKIVKKMCEQTTGIENS